MDILILASLTTVLLGSALGVIVFGALWLWGLPWHADEEVSE